MDNFDKLFQNKLGEITENDYEFKESSWERFQNEYQDENEPSRQFAPLVWMKRNIAAAAIILLLLMSNVFFAQQFLNTRMDVKKLTSTIDELRGDIISCKKQSEISTQAVANLETTLEAQTAIITEQSELINTQNERFENQNRASIFPIFPNQNGVVTNQNLNSNGNFCNNKIQNSSTSNVIPNKISNKNSNDGNIPKKSSNSSTQSGEIVNNKPTKNTSAKNNITDENPNTSTVVNSTISNSSTSEISKIPESIEELKRLLITLNNDKNNVELKKRPIPVVENEYEPEFGTKLNILKENAKPSAYQVGASSKLTFLPTFKNLPPMTMTNNGVIANALFFNNFRVQIGVNHWGQFFKIEDIETLADGIVTPFTDEYPRMSPVNPIDELTKVETKTYGFDLPITAQLMLRPNAKFNPYIGFGVIGRYFNNYQLEYYFIDYNSGYDYELKAADQIKKINFGVWESQLGFDYSITNNLLANFEINYLKSFKEQVFGLSKPQQYGASLGIKYEF